MNKEPKQAMLSKQKEMLAVMTALSFIEQNALITQAQLNDARRSLQALFIRTSGEETMLRKLLEILRVNKDLHEAFSSISKISTSISTSCEIITKKISYLKQYVARLQLSPKENSDFFTPFLSFTHQFQEKILRFNQMMMNYLEMREDEARRLNEFRVAEDASRRLRDRLSGKLGTRATGEVEESIKQEVMGNFDFASAHSIMLDAQRRSRMESNQISALLVDLKAMCQMAMNPEMREKIDNPNKTAGGYDDIFMCFTNALKRYPRLEQIKDFIIDYFKLYQRAYGMFHVDYDNFNKAVDTITSNTEEYFDSKQEDEDIRVKREKLRKYEGLIPFLENVNEMISEYADYNFDKFSKRVSDVISEGGRPWEHINEELLVAKVAAEADLTTRME
ncbi:hypothetical protein N9H39_05020 [Gammaproteobacteria bacterium]|nr:hypothetical protein [Gammaproteobacteria bacterium]